MRKYNRLFFSVLIFLVACKSTGTPNGIIKQDQMTDLLTDIHIVDGSLYNVLQVPDTLYKYGNGKYMGVFKKYHTDSVRFKKSFKYYAANPDKLEAIYEQISKNLKQKSDSLTKLNQLQMAKDNKRRTDSLNKLPKKSPTQSSVPTKLKKTNPLENPK